MFADDLADAGVFLLKQAELDYKMINIGYGTDMTIRDLAIKIKEVTEYAGELTFNAEYPDGTPQKLLDVGKIKKLGWMPKTEIIKGLEQTYSDYLKNIRNLREKTKSISS